MHILAQSGLGRDHTLCSALGLCREGIDLVLNSRVASVGRNCVTVVDSRKNETSDIPFGACVWATGVAMHPLVKQLQVGRSFALVEQPPV